MLRRQFSWLSILLLPASVFAVALALRLYGIDDRPLWLDEIHTLRRATLPLTALSVESHANMHQPAYFVLISLLLKLSDGEWLVRAPSALCGALSAAVIAAAARGVAGTVAGIAAGLLMAASPFQLIYGQEARPHAVAAFLIHVAFWGWIRLAAAAEASGGQTVAPASTTAWAAYGVGTLAALMVSNVALPWLVAANVGAAAIGWRLGAQRRPFVGRWLAIQGAIVILWLPSFLTMTAPIATAAAGRFWIPPPTLESAWAAVSAVYLMRVSDVVMFHLGPDTVPGLAAAVAALAAFGAWYLRPRPLTLGVVVLAFALLPLFLLVASLRQPIFLPRYLLWSAGPFFVLAGAGFAAIPGRLGRFFAGGALATLLAWNVHDYTRYETKPRWDLAVAHILREIRPGDALLMRDYWSPFVFRAIAAREGAADLPVAATADDAKAIRAKGGRIWAVHGRVGFGPALTPEAYAERLASAGLGAPDETIRFGAGVYALRYEPTAK